MPNPLPMSGTHSAPVPEGPSLADLFAPPKPKEAAPGEPAPAGQEDPALRARVQAILDELRPFINADGGDIELVRVVDGVVKVRMHGACVGCSSSLYTLQLGVERKIREEIPDIKMVEAVP